MSAVHAYRVALVNARGMTCGPFHVDTVTPWTATREASCRHRDPCPDPAGCTCGLYATDTRQALAPVVRSASELLAAAALNHPGPWAGTRYVVVKDDDGMPVLVDPRSAVVVLEGTLTDAHRVEAPPLRFVAVTRRMVMPADDAAREAAAGTDLDATIWHAVAEGTEPPGTWRGARFTVEAVHAVAPPAWLLELVAPLPVVAHPDPPSLTTAEAVA